MAPETEDLKARELLDQIEKDMLRLRQAYEGFFLGERRSEPSEDKVRLEDRMRKIAQRKLVSSTDQFRFNNMQSKFYSLTNLWTRKVRDLEEGRAYRSSEGFFVEGLPPETGPTISGHISETVDRLWRTREECGIATSDTELAALRETLERKAKELSDQHSGKRVEFRIAIEDGKPKVKASLK